MTHYNSLNVKLSNSQLPKLKSARKKHLILLKIQNMMDIKEVVVSLSLKLNKMNN